MPKIVPHLWFDTQAREAAEFYAATFKGDSKVNHTIALHDTPSGDSEIVSFKLHGQDFAAISAGPYFTFNPSVSFMVGCETAEEVEELWNALIEGGSALMPLDTYPFSEKYGWVQDKYGLSWQIMHIGAEQIVQKITPTLMFAGDVCGKAEEAINFYATVFPEAKVGDMARYESGDEPDQPGTIKHADFTLLGYGLAAMDSARMHDFAFNEAISLMVYCDNQEEIDYYWEKLSAVPEAEQCGWLKDKYGVSWQITPDMDEMMISADDATLARITKAFLKMKKFDLATLNKAAKGE